MLAWYYRFIKQVTFGLVQTKVQADYLLVLLTIVGLLWGIQSIISVSDSPLEDPTPVDITKNLGYAARVHTT